MPRFLHLGVRFEESEAPDRKAIEAILNRAKDWYRYAPNCWIIYTARDADWWYERLKAIPGMTANTSFLICETALDNTNKRSGWLSESTWEWINKERHERRPL